MPYVRDDSHWRPYSAQDDPIIHFAFRLSFSGLANIAIALGLGAVLLFYLWRRDLVANMIGHFMIDFIANVLPRLF